jgi:hypothetical protein
MINIFILKEIDYFFEKALTLKLKKIFFFIIKFKI